MAPRVVIKQTEPEVPVEILVTAITQVAKGMAALNASRLKRETVVALLHDTSGIAKSTIRIILNNLEALEQTHLKPKPATRK